MIQGLRYQEAGYKSGHKCEGQGHMPWTRKLLIFYSNDTFVHQLKQQKNCMITVQRSSEMIDLMVGAQSAHLHPISRIADILPGH